MGTYRQKHAVSGITYVYSREKVTDEVTGETKVVRKVVAKIDPVTGKQIPTGAVGRPSKQHLETGNACNGDTLPQAESSDYLSQIKNLTRELEIMKKKCEHHEWILQQIANLIADN